MKKKKPKIVAVLETCIDDGPAIFIIDLSKLDQSIPEIKRYHDAVVDGIKTAMGEVRLGELMNYNTDQKKWKAAIVKPPCRIDATSEVCDSDTEEEEDEEDEQ